MTPQDINQFNLQMRSQPWYQQWFTQHGLDPNKVHLNDAQRNELLHVAAQNGMPLPHGMIVDPAGNLNDHHGFAGQPGWAKALEIGGAGAAGAFFGGPALMGLLGHSGAVAPAVGIGSTDIPGIAGSLVPTVTGGASTMAGAIPSLAPSFSASGAAALAPAIHGVTPSGGNIMSSLLGKIGKIGGGGSNGVDMADAGSMLESVANSEANNRLNRGEQSQGYDQLMLNSAANRRTDESDAMKKLAITSYLMGGGAHNEPQSISLGGQQRQLPDYGLSPAPASDAQKQGASTLQEQLLKRLQPGGSYTPTPLDSYSKPGTTENVGRYGSLITGGLGVAKSLFGF